MRNLEQQPLTLDGQRVAMVEFSDGKVFQVFITDTGNYFEHYDFEWCKRDENYYYDKSGSGPTMYLEGDGGCWVDPAFASLVDLDGDEALTRLETIPDDLQEVLNLSFEGDAEWCGRCKDMLPTHNLCEHIYWCERCAWWSTPDSRSKTDEGGCKHNRRQAAA